MNTQSQFEHLFKQITEVLPKGLFTLHQDLEKNLRMTLESSLRRLNLVTREEFEVQTAVLARTRARLETLEARVTALEALKVTPLPDQHSSE